MRSLRVPPTNTTPAFVPPVAEHMRPFVNMSENMNASYSSFRYFPECLSAQLLPEDLALDIYQWKAHMGGVVLGDSTYV